MRLLTNKFVYTRKCNETLANYRHLNSSPRIQSLPRIQNWIATVKTGQPESNSKPDKDILNDHSKTADMQSMQEWHDKVVFSTVFSDTRTPCYRRMSYFQKFMLMVDSCSRLEMMIKRWYKIVEKSSTETERYGPDHTMLTNTV